MYEDYLEVAARASYGHRHKLAAFWRILETKTNDRVTYNEEAERQGLAKLDMWVEIPYSECVNRSLETFKSSSFQVAAAESERLGFSKSRARKRRTNPLDPQSPLEDYKEYLFLSEIMQIALNGGEHPTPIENNSPLLKALSERKEKRKKEKAIENNTPPIENNSPGIENNRETPIENNSGAIEINNKKDIKDTTKDNKDTEVDSFGGFADATPPTSSDFDLTEEDLKVDDTDDDETVELPVVKKPPTTSKPAQDTPPVHVEAEPEQDAPGQDENNSHSQLSTPSTSYAQKPEQQALMGAAPPRQSARQQKKVPVTKPAKEAKPELTPEEVALQARCKTWYDRITDWCGGPMTKGGQVINEHKTVKLACQKYSDAQLEAIFTYLTTRDWKYSKIDNKYTVRCYIVWDESGRVAQILKEERQSKGQPGHATPLSAAISATRDLSKEMATLEARWTNRKRVQA